MKKIALICSLLLAFASVSYANSNDIATINDSSEKSIAVSVSDDTAFEYKYLVSNEKIQKITLRQHFCQMLAQRIGRKRPGRNYYRTIRDFRDLSMLHCYERMLCKCLCDMA